MNKKILIRTISSTAALTAGVIAFQFYHKKKAKCIRFSGYMEGYDEGYDD